jgi:hypothetical protein
LAVLAVRFRRSEGDDCLYAAASALLITGMEEVSELFAEAMEGRDVMKQKLIPKVCVRDNELWPDRAR